MRIYLASSWKNNEKVKEIAEQLRLEGHQVDCFCDNTGGRFTFPTLTEEERVEFDCQSFLEDPRSQEAFKTDKEMLDWAQAVVLILPCGNSAHLEAGYAKGQFKELVILGDFPKGEFDVMYGFADLLCREVSEVIEYFNSPLTETGRVKFTWRDRIGGLDYSQKMDFSWTRSGCAPDRRAF